MNRIIPNLSRPITMPIIGKGERTPENWITSIESFERKLESSLKETLNRVNITATTKTVPSSLPHTNEIIVTLYGESWMNGAYEIFRVARPIVKKLLEDNEHKIRFYVKVEVLTEDENGKSINFGFGKVVYCFRYFSH